MIKTIKNIMMSLSAAMLFSAPIVAPVSVYAQEIGDRVNCGANLEFTTEDMGCPAEEGPAQERINTIIKIVVNTFSVVVGIIAVIMIIVGGLKYITSGGDSGNVTGAKNTILYAVVGLVVVALAQFVVRFVLAKATNASGA